MGETKITLPCKHEERVTDQVAPAINLLSNMDELHPEVLYQHKIQPDDYKNGLVFRSAVESIRGTFIASSTTGRELLMRDVLQNLKYKNKIVAYKKTGASNRYDFEVEVESDYFAYFEVKGGEGNSINISDRPLAAKEFCVWSHLDGAIVNQPAHGAHAIINRLTNEMVRKEKMVDALFFKDVLCGTRTRPCPKYPGQECEIGLKAAPDVFLFPERIPSSEDPEPPVHTLDTLKLPQLILELFSVDPARYDDHVWSVHVSVVKLPKGYLKRVVKVWHQGKLVDTSESRKWKQ